MEQARRWGGVAAGFAMLVLAACGRPAPPPPPWETPPATIDAGGGARVIDGDTLELELGGHRLGVGLAGVAAPIDTTACGREATGRLWALAGGGLRLERENARTGPDARGRWLYRATGYDGRSVGEDLVRSGFARADPNADAALKTAETEARAARRGCLWGGGPVAPVAAPPLQGETRVGALAAALPSGFTQEVVAAGLTNPTAFAFLPDGRVLVAEKAGTVRVVKNGTVLAAPFIDIRARVNDYWDHGLLGIAADRDFATNGFVYLLYTYENDETQHNGTKTARLTRVTATGDAASLASETVILGRSVGATCAEFPPGADCLPSEGTSHSIGSVKVAPDGSLFVTVGDAASFNFVDDLALRAQDLDSLAGKVLHIAPDGGGLSSNPFWNGSASANRSKVWAYGVRNGFRMNLRPGGVPYLGDVGWNSWEEVNVAAAGANLGWPCFEGNGRQRGYESKPFCRALYAQGTAVVRPPLVTWDHAAGGASAVGGAFYSGTAYPPEYRGAYFYGDYSRKFIRFLRVNAADALTGGPTDFATAVDGFVGLEPGPDGNLYFLSITARELQRIRYVGASALTCPVGQYRAEYRNAKTFDGAPAFQQCEAAINYDWASGGPGNGITVDNFSARWTGRHTFAAGDHTFTARSDDGVRLWVDGALLIDAWKTQAATTYTATRRLTAGEHEVKVEYFEGTGRAFARLGWQSAIANRPPVATIATPTASLRYKVGDLVSFSGSATDPETGAVPDAGLAWQVTIHHCPGGVCHSHLLRSVVGQGGSFTVPDHGDDTHLEIALTATDGGGLADRASVRLQPETVQLTLDTVPSGLQVVYDGTVRTAPFVRSSIVGSRHPISAPSPQGNLGFASWSDGGAKEHDVTLGAADTTLTATFADLGLGGPPAAIIAAPAASLRYKVGDTVSFSGSATDPEDGVIPDAGLAWQVTIHHCSGGVCHSHPLHNVTGPGGSFTVPDHGDGTHLEIALTATDTAGFSGEASVNLQPQTVQLTLDTVPSGLEVMYDDTVRTTPFVGASIVGARHTVSAPGPQRGLEFGSWSDGGAQEHEVTLGDADVTLSATFASPSLPGGSHRVINRNSNRCLDVNGVSKADGATVHQWACLGDAKYNQHWRFVATDGGYYRIVSRHSNKDLTVVNGSTTDGAKTIQWGWLGGPNQQWRPAALGGGYYTFVARHSGKVLEVPNCSASNGVQFQQWSDLGSPCQAFRLEAAGP